MVDVVDVDRVVVNTGALIAPAAADALEIAGQLPLQLDQHWTGIAAYCKSENKVALGFVEGFNNKIRVLQRRAYGLRDEEYLRLKILTCMLPDL